MICNNGKRSITALEDGDFNLILMDIQMPVMDGVTAMKEFTTEPSASLPYSAIW